MTKLRRNMVVVRNPKHHWAPYGRVNSVLPNGMVEVIEPGAFYLIHQDQLEVVEKYKGRWDRILNNDLISRDVHEYRWNVMPSLRKMKQNISYMCPYVWKRNRKTGSWASESEIVELRLANPNETIMFGWRKNEGAD